MKKSQYFAFTGPELNTLLDKTDELLKLATPGVDTTAARQWFAKWQKMRHYLLGKKRFTEESLEDFNSVVQHIQSNWHDVSGWNPFPKLHMMSHCVDFARRIGYLGPFSEQAIESQHALVRKAREKHRNSVRVKPEQLRRMLVTESVNQYLRFKNMHSDLAYDDTITDTDSDM